MFRAQKAIYEQREKRLKDTITWFEEELRVVKMDLQHEKQCSADRLRLMREYQEWYEHYKRLYQMTWWEKVREFIRRSR